MLSSQFSRSRVVRVEARGAPSPLTVNKRRRDRAPAPSDISAPLTRTSSTDPAPAILEAFFFGRALAITLNRRLSEAAIDVVSEVSKALAERPQRILDFQEEVTALARKEMANSGYALPETTSGSAAAGSSGSGSSSSSSSLASQRTDPQAVVDDLRAEIAYARASLQQIRTQQQTPAQKAGLQ